MRVLYVDANAWHINPTANLLPIMIGERFPAASFYGPGFVGDEELASGLNAYVATHGPFDVAILGPATPFLGEGEAADAGAVGFLRRYASHRMADSSLLHFFAEARACFPPSRAGKGCVLNFDYYATTQAQIDTLLEQSISVLGPNEQFVLALENLAGLASKEKHLIRKQRFFQCLAEFSEAAPGACYYGDSFRWAAGILLEPLAARPYEVAVPGVECFA